MFKAAELVPWKKPNPLIKALRKKDCSVTEWKITFQDNLIWN